MAAGIEMTEYTVPSDPGIQLYGREKHPAGAQPFGTERIVLFVHGATYPAETSVDLPVGGASMMDLLAARGWDVWLVDVRGYSRFTRPASMGRPAAEGKPATSTAEAARDVAAAVDFIQQRRGVAKINLKGWSWGTSIMGLYTSTHNERVERLVLYAPQWLSTSKVPANAPPLGAYRTVTGDATLERWLMGVPADKRADLIPLGWFDQWADATFAPDPVGAKQTPPVLRAPNGVGQDSLRLLAGRQAAVSAVGHPRANLAAARRVGRGPADLPDAGLLQPAHPCAVQALGRARRGDAYGHAGEEPYAVLPRAGGFS